MAAPCRLNVCDCFFNFIVAALLISSVSSQPMAASQIRCEGNILAVNKEECSFATDNQHPSFSWTAEHTQRNAHQSAFRIILYHKSSANESLTVHWDSGKVAGREMITTYDGPPLRSLATYSFTVAWWDHENVPAPVSAPGCFTTGFLYGEWEMSNAEWITARSVAGAPYIRKEFVSSKVITSVEVVISGLGYYRLYMNGNEITEGYPEGSVVALRPGWTQYEVRVAYQVFHLSKRLAGQKSIVAGVILGLGWRNSHDYPNQDKPDSGDERLLKMTVMLAFEDKTTLNISTDDTWLVHPSPIIADTIWDGETYNASMEVPSWNEVGFKPIGWKAADIAVADIGSMYLPYIPNMVFWEKEEPKTIYSLKDSQVVDFGSNVAGVCFFRVKDLSPGTVLTLHHAEVPLHPPYGPTNGSLYYDNLRAAKATDTYIAGSPKLSEDYHHPSFTYHGFRYVEVKGFPGSLKSGDIYRMRISSALRENGKFNSSDPLVNAIQSAVVNGQESNFMSVPTDCPQRSERLGWMGDSGLSADSMVMNFDMQSFHDNFLKLINDEMYNRGSIPDVVPFYRGGNRPADPSWSAAFPQILWVHWKLLNNTKPAEMYFTSLQKYITYMVSKIPPDGLAKYFGYYGDWCPPPHIPKVPISFTSAFSLLFNIKQTAELSQALNKTAEYENYTKLFSQLSEDFNKAFVNSNGTYIDGSQISYALPLALDIVPSKEKSAFLKNFTSRIQSDGVHVTSGIIGVKFLLPVLSANGYNDLAVEIATQKDYPGWGFMLLNTLEPSTSIWELWNSFNGSAGMDSRNHHMFSSVSGWFRKEMIGLHLVPGASLFSSVELKPGLLQDLVEASTRLDHPHKFEYSWKQFPRRVCFKLPEKPLEGNVLLEREEYIISCPSKGSVIEEVVFASFGTPQGTCGHLRYGECHAPSTLHRVRDLCVGREECRVPVDHKYWDTSCSGSVNQWLYAEVICTQKWYHNIRVNVTIPMGGSAKLHLPAYGSSSMSVFDGDKLLWKDGATVEKSAGIAVEEWESKLDSLPLHLQSGHYELRTETLDPMHVLCEHSADDTIALTCPPGTLLRRVMFASYGTPRIDDGCPHGYSVGECHSVTSKQVVEEVCVGKSKCLLELNSKVFGSLSCSTVKLYSMAVVYACSTQLNK